MTCLAVAGRKACKVGVFGHHQRLHCTNTPKNLNLQRARLVLLTLSQAGFVINDCITDFFGARIHPSRS